MGYFFFFFFFKTTEYRHFSNDIINSVIFSHLVLFSGDTKQPPEEGKRSLWLFMHFSERQGPGGGVGLGWGGNWL